MLFIKRADLKYVFYVLCLAVNLLNKANAATYYFSSTLGNDLRTSAEARLQKTPWKTLDKLNSLFNTFVAGDSILFKRGDTFFGSIIITKSGSPGSPIFFGSYDVGDKPLITGLTTLNAWTSVQAGIYQSSCASCISSQNLLVLNGIPQRLGRYPDIGFFTYESHTDNNSINTLLLTAGTNWTNAEVVIRKNRWTIDRNLVTGNTGKNIFYKTGSTELPTDGFGFFIQNDRRTLDQEGEWYFDSGSKTMMVYFGSTPTTSYKIETSSINELVTINGQNFIVFDGLSFQGSNEYGFKLNNSQYVSILNCDVMLSGADAIVAENSGDLKIENCLINHCLNDAIKLDENSRRSIVRNNTIKNIGLIPGMGKSGTGTYEAITSFGEQSNIEYNTIDSVGYDGIYFKGNGSQAKNNSIANFCLTKDDGAGIYVGDYGTPDSKKIIGNVIINGRGNASGTNDSESLQAEGIYVDDNTANVEIRNNSIAHCANTGIKIHNARDIIITGNTCFSNGTQLAMIHDNIAPNAVIRNVIQADNKFAATTASQRSVYYSSIADDLNQFGSSDNNSYARPFNDVNVFECLSINNGKELWHSSNLDQFQKRYGQETHSQYITFGSPEYTIEGSLSGNKFTNGHFDKNINGTNDVLGTAIASWDGSGKIDGGSLKITCNDRSSTSNVSTISLPIGVLNAAKNYIVRFKVFSEKEGRTLGVFLRQNHDAYKVISPVKYFTIDNNVMTCEALFSAIAADQNASVGFKFSDEDNLIWIDDVEFGEAEVVGSRKSNNLLFK